MTNGNVWNIKRVISIYITSIANQIVKKCFNHDVKKDFNLRPKFQKDFKP